MSRKIFISYTMRDSHVDIVLLESIESLLSLYVEVYIDKLHNNSVEKQKYVEENLRDSDILLLIESDSINKSEWVKKELNIAKGIQLPIIKVRAELDKNITLLKIKEEILKFIS